MQTFLEETLFTIQSEYSDISDLTIILPSKRAGGFLKNILRNQASKTIFAPKIMSIEEFIEELSNLKIIDTTELLFKSYDAYQKSNTLLEMETFESFSIWAATLLSDFSEIDRNLVDVEPFFSYLENIKTLERWGVKEEKTKFIENYLKFWGSLSAWYENLWQILQKEGVGYQGMAYREAAKNIEDYLKLDTRNTYILIGFNALNNAEQFIFQKLLESGNTKIYWDLDQNFLEDKGHEVSFFIRKYLNEWGYYKSNMPKGIGRNFEQEKKIRIIEAQKNVGQAKYVGQILASFTNEELGKTAVVLGDENLLIPVLNSLPDNITSVNITMGASLKNFPATLFFELLLTLHYHNSETLYYKQVLAILNHPLSSAIFPGAAKLSEKIISENTSHVRLSDLVKLSEEENKEMLESLFGNWENNSQIAVKTCITLLLHLQQQFQKNLVDRVVLFHLFEVFKKLESLQTKYSFLKSVGTVQHLFMDLISTATVAFKGDAYNGLQIMGILETRLLDFENVILTSVNEGVLPSGKSNASVITFDLKQQFGLPLYTEKDAIYSYHFYRLLCRSENIFLLFNNYSEGLNSGEKSRFILQLEIEKKDRHAIEKIVLSPKILNKPKALKQINKTESVMVRLREIAEKGFSPSSLTSYIRNPIDFYFQKIIQLREFTEIEETVAANTLGTIVHDCLEKFYKPLEGQFLAREMVLQMKENSSAEVTAQFKKTYKGNFAKGKNLIIFEVAKKYLNRFLDFEIAEIQNGNQIKILQIESKIEVEIPIPELDFPVKIAGKVDRVDEYNGQLRIIDYKTGMVQPADLVIADWDELIVDYKYSKAFQVLAYALMINKNIPIQTAEAGIISFKNLNSGFLKFGTRENKEKHQIIGPQILSLFTSELIKLITEICDPNLPFIEKEIEAR